MRVRFKGSHKVCVDDQPIQPGGVIDVSEAVALSLIEEGDFERVDAPEENEPTIESEEVS